MSKTTGNETAGTGNTINTLLVCVYAYITEGTTIFSGTKPVGLFSPEHLIFLAAAAFFCAAMIFAGGRLGQKGRRVKDTMFGSSVKKMLSFFVQNEDISDEELQEILELINENDHSL